MNQPPNPMTHNDQYFYKQLVEIRTLMARLEEYVKLISKTVVDQAAYESDQLELRQSRVEEKLKSLEESLEEHVYTFDAHDNPIHIPKGMKK